MRVLGIGHSNDLGDLYLRLAARGHNVRVYVHDRDSHDVLEGMVHRARDWKRELAWIGEERETSVIVFEGIGWGGAQDALRREGFRVVGGSAFGDRLETDREFGQRMLAGAGLKTAAMHGFTSFDAAIEFVQRASSRYVLKFNGAGFASTRNYVGVLENGADMVAALTVQRQRWALDETPNFVLMDHVSGVEVGVGAFFDGEQFVMPANLDWEHKRFFPGDLGELTGEMGTLVTYRGADRLFDAVLAPIAPALRDAGHVGYVNVNTIVNADGIWPLEFTCRFGYPGFAILDALHRDPYEAIFEQMLSKRGGHFATYDGFAVGVVITVPPFPYADGYARLSKGAPVSFAPLEEGDRDALHFGEVKREGAMLVMAGVVGYAMVVTGRGASVEEARARAYAVARKVVIPNARYRLDIGEAFLAHDRRTLQRLGLFA